MYHGSDEELRAAEMAGRVYDNLCTSMPGELHGIRQVHTSHIGGASLDAESDSVYGSHNTSTAQHSQRRRMGGGGGMHACMQQSGVNGVVEIARRESVLRQLYNDKLRGSISAIMSALTNELPRDHIFLQLLNDPSTEQYSRVRVGEVVESFLFSVQAHQYHNLASELAKREVEVLTLTAQLEEAQQIILNNNNNNNASTSPHIKSFKTTQTDNRVDAGMNTGRNVEDNGDEAALAAHDELLALLEDVTREHELAKCRECLSAPTSLLETIEAEGNYRDKYEYLDDVVAHLFRSVQGLVMYAEGSLNSLESLRHGLSGVWGNNNNNDNQNNNNNNNNNSNPSRQTGLHTSSPNSVGRSPSSVSVVSAPRPHQQQQQEEQQQRTAVFEEERARLETLAAQLKYAQRHCGDIIKALGKGQMELQRQCDANHQQMEQYRQVAVRNNTHELGKALKANETALVQLREGLQQSFAAERAKAREREDEFEQRLAQQAAEMQRVTELLSVTRQQLQMEAERRARAVQRMQEAEEALAEAKRNCGATVSDLQRDLEAERNAVNVKLRNTQRELVARRVEALCARHECMALDSQVSKMELMIAHGYAKAAAEQHYIVLLAKEAVRHAETQASAAQNALREREATSQQCYKDLCSLLECIREDEYKAEIRQREEEAETEAGRYTASLRKTNNINNENRGINSSSNGNNDNNNHHQHHNHPPAPPSQGENELVMENGSQGSAQALLHRYGMPKTLTGVVTGLQNAYEAIQRHQRYMQHTVDAANDRVRQLQQDDITLRARLDQLMTDYEEQQASFKRMWNEQALWERQETLKGLLAKQEALLAAVNMEREALQMRWSSLSEEYQSLERRNSQLHERCAAKEVENARLLGYLRAKRIVSPESLQETIKCKEEKVKGKDAVNVDNSPFATQTETETLRRHHGSWGSSSAAGLSGQARTSCSSVLDDESSAGVNNNNNNNNNNNSGVGVAMPLGYVPRDRDVWRKACRFGQGISKTPPPATVATTEEEDK